MKTFVISDIHGCYREFSELLAITGDDFRIDQLIILGDYIDRGPLSYEVVKKVMSLQKEYGSDHVILLRGNHEQMAIDYYKTSSIDWDYNENDKTIASFLKNHDNIKNYLDYFSSLPLIYQDDYAIYVHAGINPDRQLEEQSDSDLLWIREDFIKSRVRFPKTVIFGHTSTFFMTGRDYPFIRSDRIGIDTGCVYGGSLTCVELYEGKVSNVYQVKKK
jgi:serine/threonine protein phosphatase 1